MPVQKLKQTGNLVYSQLQSPITSRTGVDTGLLSGTGPCSTSTGAIRSLKARFLFLPFTTSFLGGMKTSKRAAFLVVRISSCGMREVTVSSLTPPRLLFHLSSSPFVLTQRKSEKSLLLYVLRPITKKSVKGLCEREWRRGQGILSAPRPCLITSRR